MSCRMDERIPSPLRKGKRVTLGTISKARWKAKNVGWLVAVAVITPQALHHAERVGRPFKQLGELLIVQIQTGTLHRLGAGLPRGNVSLLSGAGQSWRWGHARRLRAGAELRMLAIPAARLLVGMAN